MNFIRLRMLANATLKSIIVPRSMQAPISPQRPGTLTDMDRGDGSIEPIEEVPEDIQAYGLSIPENFPDVYLAQALREIEELKQSKIDATRSFLEKSKYAKMMKCYKPSAMGNAHLYFMGARGRGSLVEWAIEKSKKYSDVEFLKIFTTLYLNVMPGGPGYGIAYPEITEIPIAEEGHWLLMNADKVRYRMLGKMRSEQIRDCEYNVYGVEAITEKWEHALNGTLIHEFWIPTQPGCDILFIYTGAGKTFSPLYGRSGTGIMESLNYPVATSWQITVDNMMFCVNEGLLEKIGEEQEKSGIVKIPSGVLHPTVMLAMREKARHLYSINWNYKLIQNTYYTHPIKHIPMNLSHIFQSAVEEKDKNLSWEEFFRIYNENKESLSRE